MVTIIKIPVYFIMTTGNIDRSKLTGTEARKEADFFLETLLGIDDEGKPSTFLQEVSKELVDNLKTTLKIGKLELSVKSETQMMLDAIKKK